jgi:hypothetical protein
MSKIVSLGGSFNSAEVGTSNDPNFTSQLQKHHIRAAFASKTGLSPLLG